MRKASVHKKQSELNEEAAKNAAQSGFPDWAVTMCFYAALHYIEAYALHNGDDIGNLYRNFPTQHERRLAYVQDLNFAISPDNSLYASYEMLYEASKIARYLQGISATSNNYFNKSYPKYFTALATIKAKLGTF